MAIGLTPGAMVAWQNSSCILRVVMGHRSDCVLTLRLNTAMVKEREALSVCVDPVPGANAFRQGDALLWMDVRQ